MRVDELVLLNVFVNRKLSTEIGLATPKPSFPLNFAPFCPLPRSSFMSGFLLKEVGFKRITGQRKNSIGGTVHRVKTFSLYRYESNSFDRIQFLKVTWKWEEKIVGIIYIGGICTSFYWD